MKSAYALGPATPTPTPRYNAKKLTTDPVSTLPPPPRPVRYKPFVRPTRILWIAVVAVIALLPVIGLLTGYTHGEIGGTSAPKSAVVLNARIGARSIDANGDGQMDLQYQLNNRTYAQQIWVPRSYYDQMASMTYAPITVPDPGFPTNFYIGPPRGRPGVPIVGIYGAIEVLAVLLLCVCGYFEFQRVTEYRLLRHGYEGTGTIEYQQDPEGEMHVLLGIRTREGEFTSHLPLHSDPAENPPEGSVVPVLYMPDDPSTMKLMQEFKSCELIEPVDHPPIKRRP